MSKKKKRSIPAVSEIDILGTTYKLIESDEILDEDAMGLTYLYDKKIILLSPQKMKSLTDIEAAHEDFRKYVLIHEVCHAWLLEAGFPDAAYSEQTVDWLAINIPKIVKILKKVNAL